MKESYASQGLTDVQELARGQGHGQGDPCLPRSSPTRREGPSRTQSNFWTPVESNVAISHQEDVDIQNLQGGNKIEYRLY